MAEESEKDEEVVEETAKPEVGETKVAETVAAVAQEGKKAEVAQKKPEEVAESTASAEEPKREKTAAEIFLELDPTEGEAPKILKAKGSKNVNSGIVHVRATFNNTIVTITDEKGNSIGWSSSGKLGFRGSRKSTAYAGQLVSQDACRQAMSHGLKQAEVKVKGPGVGRESAVRAVQAIGIEITKITDVTPVPHNGCRPPKARRV
jgi:small subunit ribosomal protein S11